MTMCADAEDARGQQDAEPGPATAGIAPVTGLAPMKHVSRESILEFEKILKGMPQVEVRIEHEFAHGVCARTMYLNAGTTLVGKLHKTRHLFFVMKGVVLVTTESGAARYEAPVMVVSNPGDKRVIHAVTDVVWTNIHATNETDIKVIESEVIAQDYESLISLQQE